MSNRQTSIFDRDSMELTAQALWGVRESTCLKVLVLIRKLPEYRKVLFSLKVGWLHTFFRLFDCPEINLYCTFDFLLLIKWCNAP